MGLSKKFQLVSKDNLASAADEFDLVIDLVDGKFSPTLNEKKLWSWRIGSTKYDDERVKKTIFLRWVSIAEKVGLKDLINESNRIAIVTKDGKETFFSLAFVKFVEWLISRKS